MSRHLDILDEEEHLRNPLFGSLAFHGAIAAAVAFWGALGLGSRVEHWGDPKSLGGGAVAITPVNRIPLPTRSGRINPVANDTESQVPSAPVKPQPKAAAKKPEPDAVAIRAKNAPKKPAPVTNPQKYSSRELRPNQIYSTTGQAAVSPLYSLAPGGGGVGSGSNSPFGNRFGWYEQILRERVARNWRSQELDSRVGNPVIVTFEILRNGTIRSVQVTRSSGNFAMDQSAQRAIVASAPLPQLPAQYERDSALIEFWFRLQQ